MQGQHVFLIHRRFYHLILRWGVLKRLKAIWKFIHNWWLLRSLLDPMTYYLVFLTVIWTKNLFLGLALLTLYLFYHPYSIGWNKNHNFQKIFLEMLRVLKLNFLLAKWMVTSSLPIWFSGVFSQHRFRIHIVCPFLAEASSSLEFMPCGESNYSFLPYPR